MLPVGRLGDLKLVAQMPEDALIANIKQSLVALDSGAGVDSAGEKFFRLPSFMVWLTSSQTRW